MMSYIPLLFQRPICIIFDFSFSLEIVSVYASILSSTARSMCICRQANILPNLEFFFFFKIEPVFVFYNSFFFLLSQQLVFCVGRLNFKSLIQFLETLPVELIETYFSNSSFDLSSKGSFLVTLLWTFVQGLSTNAQYITLFSLGNQFLRKL